MKEAKGMKSARKIPSFLLRKDDLETGLRNNLLFRDYL